MRFMGYQQNGYRLWDSENNKIVVSRDVRFDENQIKYSEINNEEENSHNYYYEKEDNQKDTEDGKNSKKSVEIEENVSMKRIGNEEATKKVMK